jgi:hypothetical protein
MSNSNRSNLARSRRRGSLLLMVCVMLSMTAVLALCMTRLHVTAEKEQHAAQQEIHVELLADAALSRSYVEVMNGRTGVYGTQAAPVAIEGGKAYVTSSTFGAAANLLRLTSTATAGKAEATSELVLKSNVDPRDIWAAFGIDWVNLSSQAKVDSYDSALGTYAAQAVHGAGSNSYALTNGNVGSDGNISMSQNSLIFGNAQAGPGDTTTVIGNAAVSGSTAPMVTAITWPAVTLPVNPANGNTSFNNNATVATGTHAYGSTTIGGNVQLSVTGPATLVFDSLTLRTGSSIVVDSTHGPVSIYIANNLVMNSNTTIHALDYKPAGIQVNLLSDNVFDPSVQVALDTVTFNSNSSLYGTIYAPTAAITIDSNFQVYGGIVSRRVDLRSNSRVHFDQALTRVVTPGLPLFTRVSWRVMR